MDSSETGSPNVPLSSRVEYRGARSHEENAGGASARGNSRSPKGLRRDYWIPSRAPSAYRSRGERSGHPDAPVADVRAAAAANAANGGYASANHYARPDTGTHNITDTFHRCCKFNI